MTNNERLKIELALKAIEQISWRTESVDVIKARVDTARNILTHIDFWTPLKKKRSKE